MEGDNKNVLIFATGEKEEGRGGSGFLELVEFTRTKPPILGANIVAAISNYPNGGVHTKADAVKTTFECWKGPWTAEGYRNFVKKYEADYVMLSGWLKPVRGLPTDRVINIHPGPLPETKGLWGHSVHERVIQLYKEGKLKQSAVTMHFVPDFDSSGYDCGPEFFRLPVIIRPTDDADKLGERVNEKERAWQAYMLNLVVNGHIFLSSDDPTQVVYMDDTPKRLFFQEK